MLCWLFVLAVSTTETAAVLAGFLPARASGLVQLTGALPVWLTPLTATLVHADIFHLVFNLLVLVYCGRKVEEARGPGFLLSLYLVGAYAAALAQFALDPAARVPMIGASGAVSAVLAAYALMFGEMRTHSGRPLTPLARVLWLAAGWIGVQLLIGYAFAERGPMIAVAAHIGGFVAGILLITLWRGRAARR